ncbi:HIT domain-containing protein [bacterium]|nr:HIT domain-containing protein [bacterium]
MINRDIKLAPWRMKYLEGSGISNCFVCEALKQKPDPKNLVLIKTENTAVMLNRYPYNNGHLMIVPLAHVPNLQLLNKLVLCEMMLWIKTSESILQKIYKPDGFNIGINIGTAAGAGLDSHLHIHILPRWSGDTNFMTTVADIRVIPEELPVTWNRLEPHFKSHLKEVVL